MCFRNHFELLAGLYWNWKSPKYMLQSITYKYYSYFITNYLESFGISSSDGVIYNSNLVKREIEDRYNQIKRGLVIPNAVNPGIFSVEANPSESGEYILHVGGSRRKGIDTLLEAWESYNGSIDKLIIAGGIVHPEDKKEAKQLDGVELLGLVPQNELAQLYSGAKALIHPARYESFGNVVFESVACGTPVVASKETVGAAEFIPEKAFLPVDPNDPRSVQTRIEKLEGMNTRIPTTIVEDFVATHTWDRVSRETISFISSISRSH